MRLTSSVTRERANGRRVLAEEGVDWDTISTAVTSEVVGTPLSVFVSPSWR